MYSASLYWYKQDTRGARERSRSNKNHIDTLGKHACALEEHGILDCPKKLVPMQIVRHLCVNVGIPFCIRIMRPNFLRRY